MRLLVMVYYMADFIRMGASFTPKAKPKTLANGKLLLLGVLAYDGIEVKVAVESAPGSVSKITKVLGVESENDPTGKIDSMMNQRKLALLYALAIDKDINGSRKCIRTRTLVMLVFAICMIALSLCWASGIVGFFMLKKFSCLFLTLLCTVILRVLYCFRWSIIPYGHMEGKIYGVELQEK